MFKEQFSKMSAFRKRAFAVALSAAVVSTSFNVGAYAVEGGSSANGRVITAFEELPEDILYQNLPVGAKESDINFPKELNITLYSDTEEKTEEQPEDSGDIVIEEPEQENTEEEPASQDGGEGGAPEAGAGESGSGEAVDTGAGNTETGAETGSTESGATEAGAGAGETAPAAEGSSEPTGETAGEAPAAGEGNTESGTSEESTNDEGSSEEPGGGDSQESSQEESGSSESSGETAVDESAIQGIRSTAAAVIRAFKPVTVYAAENEDGGEQSESGDSEDSGEQSESGDSEDSGEQPESGENENSGEDENKENEGDAQNEGGAENTDNSGNIEQPEGNEGGEAAAPAEESGSSEDGNSEPANSDSENTEGNTDDGITELSDGEARVLRDVNWKLVRDESAYSKFQAVLEGDVFVYEPKISEYGLKSDVELPKIRVTIVAAEETVSEDTVSEDTVSEDAVSGNSPAFNQMMIVGGVRVTVEAPEGVFPEGAVLHVTKLEGEKLEKAENYVKEDMGVSGSSEDEDGEEESEEGNSSNLEMVAFDVTITDAEGNEIQPNTEFGEATVKFANVDLVGSYLDAQEGEDSEDGGKSAELKVYHFDENMESAETPEVQVDGGDKAATVNAGHFSPFVLTAQATSEYMGKANEETTYSYGEYKFVFKGGYFKFTPEYNGYVTVYVKEMATSDGAKIDVYSKDGGKVTEGLRFLGGTADVEVDVKLTDGLNIEVNNDGALIFGSTSGRNYPKIKPTLIIGNGTTTITNKAGYNGVISLYETPLTIRCEEGFEDKDCILELNGVPSGENGYVIIGHSFTYPNGIYSGVNINSGTIKANNTIGNLLNVTINGGHVVMDGGKNLKFPTNNNCVFKGGYHLINSAQFNDDIISNLEEDFTSIGISDYDKYGYSYTAGAKNQHIMKFPFKYAKLVAVYGKGVSDYTYKTDYSEKGVYTDENGQLYLWFKNGEAPSSVDLDVEGVGLTRFVLNRSTDKLEKTNSTLQIFGLGHINEMIKYTPVTDIEVDVDRLAAESDNYLRDFTTLLAGDESVSGNKLINNDLANQFWDIKWSINPYSYYDGAQIKDDASYDTKLHLQQLGNTIYTLTAELEDIYGISKKITREFIIKKPIYVKSIKVVSGNSEISGQKDKRVLEGLSIGKEYIFNLSGNNATADYAFSTNPDNADNRKIVLTLEESDGIIKKDDDKKDEWHYTYTFLKPGTYHLKATIENALKNGGNYEETFIVKVTDNQFALTMDEDWEYTGEAYASTSLSSKFHPTLNGSAIAANEVKYAFADLAGSNVVELDDDTGEYVITDDKLKKDRSDVSNIDVNSYTWDNGKPLSQYTTVSPNAGVYLVRCQHGTSDEAVYYVFKISKKAMNQDDITCTPYTGVYNGKAVSACKVPVLQGNLAKQDIDKNNDFTYYLDDDKEGSTTIPDIINAGKYKLVVALTKADNYKGTITVTPNIAPKKITDSSVNVGNIAAQYYTGSPVTLTEETLVIKDTAINKDVPLVEGTDFTTSYTNNTAIGTATVTIKGKGNYDEQSSRKKTFEIRRFNGTITLLYNGSSTKAKSYPGSVDISAEGYLVSDSESGTFSDSYTIVGLGNVTKTLYFKDANTGVILPPKDVTVTLTADIPVYVNGSEEVKDWYTADVALTTDSSKFLLSTSSSGPFANSVSVNKSGKVTVYFQDKSGKSLGTSVTKSLTINIDKTAPTGKISAVSKSWNKFQGSQKTVAYTNEQKRVTLTGNDNDSKVKNIQYYITDTFYSGENKTESAAKGKWETYNSNSKPGLSENSINYIYAKVTDNAGNSFYMSSEGIWYDTKAPKVTNVKATPKDTTATVKVTATDTKGSGVKYVYVLVKKKDESKPTAKTVKSSGKKKELSKEDGKDDFEITGLTAKTGYVVYTVAEDFCENLSEVKETKITTKESSSSSSSGTGGKGGANGAAGAGGAGAGGSNSAKRGVSSDSAKNGKGGAGGSASENGGEGDSDKIRNKVPFIDDASEGVLTGREYTSGWEKIENETLAADAPAEIHIDMNGATVVPAKLLNDFANRDVTVYLEMGDGLVWAVNGLSFTSTPEKDIDFKVKKNTKNIPSKILTEVADVYPHTNLTLSHDGDFGFTAIMSLDMGADNSGMFGNLYYYNEDAGSLEFIDSQEIGGSGNVQFEFTHASDYTVIVRGDALTEKTAAALTVENSDSDMRDYSGSSRVSGAANVAKRSNHLWLLIISIISILLCGFILFMPDKKKWGK